MPDSDDLADLFSPRLGELLVHLREQAGLSQIELADAIGVDQSLVSRIETGATRRPQRRTLMKIAQAFQEAGLQVTLEQLEMAADRPTPIGALGLDDRLVRIHDRVSSYPPELQDAFYDALYATFRLLEAARRIDQDVE